MQVLPSVNRHISIHAPARGATGTDRKFYRVQHHFNPRSREGSDRNIPKNREKEKAISIHAPARGATGRWQKHLAFPNFNPRSREGSDTHPIITLSRKLMNFNPRSREGSDGHSGICSQSEPDFNPRSREGSDASCTVFAFLSA